MMISGSEIFFRGCSICIQDHSGGNLEAPRYVLDDILTSVMFGTFLVKKKIEAIIYMDFCKHGILYSFSMRRKALRVPPAETLVDGLPQASSFGPRRNFSEVFGFVIESFQFISALDIFPWKIGCVSSFPWSMSPWSYLDLENEWGEAPDMMENISVGNDDFRLESILSQDVSYAFRITQGALWRPQELF